MYVYEDIFTGLLRLLETLYELLEARRKTLRQTCQLAGERPYFSEENFDETSGGKIQKTKLKLNQPKKT